MGIDIGLYARRLGKGSFYDNSISVDILAIDHAVFLNTTYEDCEDIVRSFPQICVC